MPPELPIACSLSATELQQRLQTMADLVRDTHRQERAAVRLGGDDGVDALPDAGADVVLSEFVDAFAAHVVAV
jgi:hypothetical protein